MPNNNRDPLTPLPSPELFFGLVGPVGIELEQVIGCLKSELERFGYKSTEIRLSALLSQLERYSSLPKAGEVPEDQRINEYMDAGDDFREALGRGDALAALAVAEVGVERRTITGDIEKPAAKQAYILNSLKHPSEIEMLRKIYGRAFNVISVYSPRSDRINMLSENIAKSRGNSDGTKYRHYAEQLVNKDNEEHEKDLGQNVRKSFPLGDLFLKKVIVGEMKPIISRFLDLLFGSPNLTPSRDETGMFFAQAASLESSDLSRQVGAVIVDGNNEIVATGFNEVPKPGGGVYREGDKPDYRDFRLEIDASARAKEDIITEIMQRLLDKDWLSDLFSTKKAKDLMLLSLYDEYRDSQSEGSVSDSEKPLLSGTRVSSLLEFGRIVHAEMNAILSSSMSGRAIKNMTLYCTTFPCHVCARHIMGAGLRRVVFIEPYPKSLTKELYRKAVCIDEEASDDNALIFEPYMGVAPRRYSQFFPMRPRKDERGKIIEWNEKAAEPVFNWITTTYLDVEVTVCGYLQEALAGLGETNDSIGNTGEG